MKSTADIEKGGTATQIFETVTHHDQEVIS